jgi:hypothetical protein
VHHPAVLEKWNKRNADFHAHRRPDHRLRRVDASRLRRAVAEIRKAEQQMALGDTFDEDQVRAALADRRK